MKRCFTSFILVTALTGWPLPAQDMAKFLDEARQSYQDVKENILKSAEEMPAGGYRFRPTPESPTFGQLIHEAARSQANLCSVLMNRSPGSGPDSESKTDLIEALRKSVRTCNSAYASVNSLNADQEVGFGTMHRSKLGLLFLNIARDNEFYGQMAAYLRLKGLIPPSKQARVIPID